jgi:hypothetical protein
MLTMHEVYGDKSLHECCPKCGLCITCGDCALSDCGKDYSKFPKIERADGSESRVSGIHTLPTNVAKG